QFRPVVSRNLPRHRREQICAVAQECSARAASSPVSRPRRVRVHPATVSVVRFGMRRQSTFTALFVFVASCGSAEKKCDVDNPVSSCSDGKVCEIVAGTPTCSVLLLIRGRVVDLSSAPISGALVTALDANDSPISPTAVSDGMGAYELRVPTERT